MSQSHGPKGAKLTGVNLGRKPLGVSVLLLSACIVGVCPVRGQYARPLAGQVLDEAGGAIQNATVTLFSDDRVLTTKADQNGLFEFASIPNARYVDATSPGFFPYSVRIAYETPERLNLTLSPASLSGCPVVTEVPLTVPSAQALPTRSVPTAQLSLSYEERSGTAPLVGRVTDEFGGPLPNTSITLLEADLNSPLATINDRLFGFGLRKRPFKKTTINKVAANEKGEFQFADRLEPGWYEVTAADGHLFGRMEFWIARENTTRISLVLTEHRACGY